MNPGKIKAPRLVLRCYAEKKGDQWQAFCLEFDLAAQADSYNEVKRKMDGMISEYVYDALAGEDKEYAYQLLNRRAPLNHWVKFYALWIGLKLFHFKHGLYRLFREPIPLAPLNA